VKSDIHPNYEEATVVCSCGNRFQTRSTAGGELHVELCNQCHPFFTGQQKFVDTGGRVQRFSDKFGNAAAVTLEKEAADKEARRKASEEAAIQAKQERDARAAEKAEKAAQYEIKSSREEAKAEVVESAPVAEAVDEPVAETADEPAEAPAEESAE
jgi:large subunit ribosomal protein L31